MLRECLNCKNQNLFEEYIAEKTPFHYSWVVRYGEKRRDYTVKNTSRKTIEWTYEELVTACKEMLLIYLKHCFSTSHEFQAMQTIRANLKYNEILLVLDFSKNYSCKYGSEIQSMHFWASERQISLHMGGFYYRNEKEDVVFQSFATFSDCLSHEASAVCARLF